MASVQRSPDVPTTLPEAIDQLMDWSRFDANWSPNTTKAYRSRLYLFAGWLRREGHSLDIAGLDVDVCRAYLRWLGEHYSPPTRCAYILPLRKLVNWLAQEHYIAEDFHERLVLPQLPRSLPKPVTVDDLPALLNMPAGTLMERRDRALVMFLLSTGCRITEALTLDRAAIPYEGDSLYVIGKGNKERLVRLVPQAKDAVHDYLRARSDRHPALFLNFDRGGHSKGHDDRLTDSGARRIMHRLQRRLGVWSLTSPHVLRHTAATILLEVTGGNAILVAEVLGHADLQTVTTYAAVMESRFADAYAAYGERLAPHPNHKEQTI